MNVVKHGLIYTFFFQIRTKEKLCLLTPLEHNNFCVNECLSQEISKLRSHAKWILSVPRHKLWRKFHIIIQSPNVNP